MTGQQKYKVLIFENQYEQFKDIRKYLSEDFDVYPQVSTDPPDVDVFKTMIDPVRIFLNDRFDPSKIAKAGDSIADYINKIDPDVLIIDHVLVGNFNAKTGIDLALFARKDQRVNDLAKPILFLSRTPSNSVRVIARIGKVIDPKFWIGKGYNGSKVLDKNFIKDEVVPQINELIKKGRFELVNIALKGIIAEINDLGGSFDTSFMSNKEIRNRVRDLDKDAADLIFSFQDKMGDAREEDITTFLNQLKNLLHYD